MLFRSRFPHSHSAGETGWKSGKPKTGFPLSHPASRRRPRFSIFGTQRPSAAQVAASRRTEHHHEVRTANPHRTERNFSQASNASDFQDHLVLETKVDFRIILRLEYAMKPGQRPERTVVAPPVTVSAQEYVPQPLSNSRAGDPGKHATARPFPAGTVRSPATATVPPRRN